MLPQASQGPFAGRSGRAKKPRHLRYWVQQPVDVYLVVRDETGTIRWMNVSRYLKGRKGESRQIEFHGERLDAAAIWRARDDFFRAVAMPA